MAAGDGGPPDEPDHSSSHRGDTSDPKKKPKDNDAVSRTGSSHGKEHEHGKQHMGFAKAAKAHRDRAGWKDPLEEERKRDRERAKQDHDKMPPPHPPDRKSTRLNSSHITRSRMQSSA